jgi:hypothetical protein
MTRPIRGAFAALLMAGAVAATPRAAGPDHVDMTWLSISNVYQEIGDVRILIDGYITRLPQSAFFGGGGGLASTRQAFKPDVAAVARLPRRARRAVERQPPAHRPQSFRSFV